MSASGVGVPSLLARPSSLRALGLNQCLAVAVVSFGCLAALAWLLVSLRLPLARDQGILAWAGSVVLSGGLPYVDAWEHKGPVSHVLYALALGAFGHSTAAIHVLDVLMLGAALATLLALGRRFASPLAGAAGFCVLFLLLNADYWNAAQPDEWAGILLLAATVLILLRGSAGSAWILCGLALGLTLLIKPLYVLHLVVPWLAARRAPRPSRALLQLACGVALPLAVCCGIYLARGRLAVLVDVYLRFNLLAHAGRHASDAPEFLARVWQVGSWPGVVVAAALAAVGYSRLAAQARATAQYLLVSAALAFAIGCLQNKFYAYHFLPCAIFVAALAGFGVVEISDWRAEASSGPAGRSLAPWALGSLLLGALWTSLMPPAAETARLWRKLVLASPAPVSAAWDGCGDFCYRDVVEAAAQAQLQTAPGTPIYSWGFDALVYFLAERPAATRFGFDYPLLVDTPPERERARRELLQDLARSQPGVILVQDGDANNLYAQSSRSELEHFPELARLLAQDYTLFFSNPSFALYRRKPPSTSRGRGVSGQDAGE